MNFTSKNLIQTHQRLDFPNALEKVRLRFCHLVLMNLYLGGFQCVHSFSKHRRKYASHVSEKRKRILSLTIVGVLLGRICCLFVLTGFPGPANTPSNQNYFQLPIFYSSEMRQSFKRLYLSDPYFYSLVLTCKIYQLFGKLEALTHYISREIPGNQSLPDFS